MADFKDDNEKTIIVTQKPDGETTKSSLLEPYLIQISGRDTGQMYKLTNRSTKVGRDPSCNIVLDDPHVSRVHAEITNEKKELTIRDLGSTNGIFVNGNRVKEQILGDGDKILIGNRFYFKFCYQDSMEQDYQHSLFQAANLDPLTQLYNRRFFVDALTKEMSFSKRNNHPLSLLMVDIDYFKKINDTYGHLAGDQVLKVVGGYLNNRLRLENISCRYGGEEFAIILRNVDSTTALQIAERIRKELAATPIEFKDQKISITLSLGLATLENNNFTTIEDMVHFADSNLYAAKQEGRNRAVFKKAA